MALLLSAAGFLPAQNLVDVPLDGLQLRIPLLLFMVGVIQAGFLGDKLLDLVLQRFPGGQLGNAMGGKSSKCNTIGLQKPRPEISSQDIF